MKAIVLYKPHARLPGHTLVNIIDSIDRDYKIIEVEEKDLASLNEEVQYVELDFEIALKGGSFSPFKFFKKNPVMLAYIGERQGDERVNAYYEINMQQFSVCNPMRPLHETYWVSCYSKYKKMTSSEYLCCVRALVNKAKSSKRSLIIYGDFEVSNPYYRYRALTYRIINELLASTRGVLIQKSAKQEVYKYYTPTTQRFEFYLDHTIYLDCTYKEAVEKALPFLETGTKQIDFKQMYRMKQKTNSLYTDLFYESISPDQKIYVPLNIENNKSSEYYIGLGLDHIHGGTGHGLLFGKKQRFDELAKVLQPDVVPTFTSPILSRGGLKSKTVTSNAYYSVIPEGKALKYKGENVYIGLVSVDGIDFTAETLRSEGGKTRIAGVWKQEVGQEGIYYDTNKINSALEQEDSESVVPIKDETGYNTMMLGIAGGKCTSYEGVATDAEFLVAQINSAPIPLQQIYGGTPSDKSVLAADLLIGIWKLEEIAKKDNKALILYIPYYTNIDAHDGANIYSILLALTAMKPGQIMITTTGEEADKRHHHTFYEDSMIKREVYIEVNAPCENVVGIICEKHLSPMTLKLYPPGEDKEIIQLERAGQVKYGEVTIYSNGEKNNFYNGSKEVMFRIENMKPGRWCLEALLENPENNKMDLWISQEEMNPYVRLSPYNTAVTIGSLGNVKTVIGVGGYHEEDMVVLKASGRGFTWDSRVAPLCVTKGNQVTTIDAVNRWQEIAGGEVAASIMVGVVATICNKWQQEIGGPLPNGLLMKHVILENLTTAPNMLLPSSSQGYGLFELNTLHKLLINPLV